MIGLRPGLAEWWCRASHMAAALTQKQQILSSNTSYGVPQFFWWFHKCIVHAIEVEASYYYNCILYRNCSALKIFLCVWLPLCWCWRFFIILRQKNFCMASSLVRQKDACNLASVFFFLCYKARQTKSFCFRMMKTRHQHKDMRHTEEKFQGAAISVEDAITISVDTSEIETSCVCTQRTWWIPCPRGCRMSSGGRGITPITSNRPLHIMGLFQCQKV